MQPENKVTWSRKLLGWGALVAMLALLGSQSDRLADLGRLGLHDYVAYWSAGRLNALGGNPYSPEELLVVQREAGWSDDWPNIMYYPPWALAVVMPLGLLPFGISRLLWLVLELGITIYSADLLWRYYGGPARDRKLAVALGLAFVPTLIALRMGQMGPVLLLGVVGFLVAERRGRDGWAGAALLLTALKPQLLYLFGLGVLLWAIDCRRWRVLAGGALALMAALGVALICNPAVLSEYRYAVAHPPAGNVTPTLGAMLRLLFGADQVWLQFLPSALGVIWLAWYWRKHRARWDWSEQAPILLCASLLTTAYGNWVFDLPLLLVPVLQVAADVRRPEQRRHASLALALFLLIDGVTLAMNLAGAAYPSFIWITPAVLLGYLLLRRQAATEYREGRGGAWIPLEPARQTR